MAGEKKEMTFEYNNIISTILFIMAIVFIGIAIYQFIFIVWGFNMTDQLEDEEKTLQLCIVYNISSKQCTNIYGGPVN